MHDKTRSKLNILLVDDEPIILSSLSDVLSLHGYHSDTAQSGEEGIRKIEENSYDLIVTDLIMGSVDGLELLDRAHQIDTDIVVIIVTGYATIESALDAIRKGAYDYLVKPFEIQNFLLAIQRGAERRRLSTENRGLIADLQGKNEQLENALNELRMTQNRLLQSERKAAVMETVIAMKHEINNPLTAIMSKIQILQEKDANTPDHCMTRDLDTMKSLVHRICETLKKLDNIKEPVSTQYCNGISMLDISGSVSDSTPVS
ncbi:response regulator [bacterium]|nr:response regulator [candidate division CSSED10-310 bacterium]